MCAEAQGELLRARALRLNCLTTHYAPLWQETFEPEMASADGFTKPDPRLPSWSGLTSTWARESALRTPYARRQALVELDALAALALGLTEEELLVSYRVQFPVLRQYERETFYDRRGRIVFTTNKGLPGIGLDRKTFEGWQDLLAAGKPVPRDLTSTDFQPPFDRCDREADLSLAYRTFQARFAGLAGGAGLG